MSNIKYYRTKQELWLSRLYGNGSIPNEAIPINSVIRAVIVNEGRQAIIKSINGIDYKPMGFNISISSDIFLAKCIPMPADPNLDLLFKGDSNE